MKCVVLKLNFILFTVIPVSIAIMTPLPLVVLYVIKLCVDRRKKNKAFSKEYENVDPSTNGTTQPNSFTTRDQPK